MDSLEGLTVVMGITGGIAAYKACEVVSRLTKLGARIFVVMTENACHFVTPLTFQTLSKNPVVTDTFAPPVSWEVEHIALAKKADLFLIAPATANIMAKMAHGLADDMLSTTVLATRAPILLAPAMNTGMWDNPATKENAATLKTRGVHFVGPAGGMLACGDSGIGRMSEPEEIVGACVEILSKKRDLAGLNVLVTAGPTREPLDPVRFLTNKSSGKMGYAIAQAAKDRGASVTLVSGPVAIQPPAGVRVLTIETTENLKEKMLENAALNDIIIQAAAPADFRPRSFSQTKIKKSGDSGFELELEQTQDVAKLVGEMKRPGQTIVCFAAETDHMEQNAREKLKKKNADLIVANDVGKPGAGFDVSTNIVTLIDIKEAREFPLMSKTEVADAILDKIIQLRGK